MSILTGHQCLSRLLNVLNIPTPSSWTASQKIETRCYLGVKERRAGMGETVSQQSNQCVYRSTGEGPLGLRH